MWVCRLPVHISPLGSCRLVADPHKNRSGFYGRFKGAPGGEIEIPPGSFSFCSFFFWRSKRKSWTAAANF